jgi:hypothetical protein
MTKIDWALELINDGNWHSIDALRRSVDFSEFEINELINFLSEYNLAQISPEKSKIKLNQDFKKLLNQIC